MPLFKCPDCHNQVSDKAQNCPKCGRAFTSPAQNNSAGCGCFIIIIVAIVLFINSCDGSSGKDKPVSLLNDSAFKPVYVAVGEIKDNGAKRFAMRIVVPDGLDRETLRKNVIHAAQDLMNKKNAKASTVWAYKKSDERRGAYSAARCVIAPFGDMAKAIAPNTSNKDMRAVVDLNEAYFKKIDVEIVSTFSEKTRRQIYKALIGAEDRACADARRKMIIKYTGDTPDKEARARDLELMMENLYKKKPGVLKEEAILAGKLEERYNTEIRKKYGVSKEDSIKIAVEGGMKYWAQE